MNILLVTTSYPPEIRSISIMMKELADDFVSRGHHVTVATFWPRYNLTEEASRQVFTVVSEENGVHVIRVKVPPRHKINYIVRGLSELISPYLLWREISRHIRYRIDAVIVYDPDRLSRNFAHLMVLASEFEKAGVVLAFVTESMEKSPEGRMLFGMKGLFAEYERTKIVERTMRGKRQKAKEGKQPGGKPPYGYELIDGKHVIYEEEAKVVRMIFEWLSRDGLTLRGIQARLNDKKIPTRNGGKFWQRCVLHRIVREEVYAGYWYYNKRVGAPARFKKGASVQRLKSREEWIQVRVPSIVSQETFEAAQRQLERNATFATRNTRRQYLLTGLIVCGRCGYRYNAKTVDEKTYYSCNSKMGYITPVNCGSRYVRGDVIEPLVWDSVKEILSQPKVIIEQIEKQRSSNNNRYLEISLQTVNHSLEKKQQEVDRLLDAYKIGAIDSQLLKREMDKTRKEQEDLVAQRQDLEKQLEEDGEHELNVDYIESFCKNISVVLDNLGFEQKRQVLREVIDRVEIDGNEVSVHGIVPLVQNDNNDEELVSITSQSCSEQCFSN